jgi:AcrR family transcriptional regulator
VSQPVADDTEDPRAPRRGRPRQGKPIARHLPRDEEILKIAGEVFFQRGFDGAKLEDIAKEAGIVKGSLYHYFESKEDIYSRLIEEIVTLADFKEPIDPSISPNVRLEEMVRRRVDMVARNPVEIGILGRQMAHMDGEIGDWARNYRRRNYEALRDVIVAGQEIGEFRPADADALAAFILGSLTVLCEWYRPGGRIDGEHLGDEMAEFIMAAVRAPSPKVVSVPNR